MAKEVWKNTSRRSAATITIYANPGDGLQQTKEYALRSYALRNNNAQASNLPTLVMPAAMQSAKSLTRCEKMVHQELKASIHHKRVRFARLV